MRVTSKTTFLAAWILLAVAILWAAPAAFGMGQGYGPGRVELQLLAGRDHVTVGTGGIWNSRDKLHIQLDPADDWRIKSYKVDLGGGEDYSPPLTTTGNPKIGHFDYKEEFTTPYANPLAEDGHIARRTLTLDLGEDLGFQWGSPWAPLRTQGVAIFLELVKVDSDGNVYANDSAWVVPELVTWVVETVDDTTAVVNDEIVAVAETGEIIEEEVIEVKSTKKGKVKKNEHQSAQKSWEVDEAEEIIAFDGGRWGWWFRFTLGHPMTGHFIDSPVAGLLLETPTYEGITDIDAKFDYFPGEEVEVSLGSISLGSTVADHKISPLDIFPSRDTEDNNVINLARLLQSLDIDGNPQGGINITPEIVGAFESAMANKGLPSLNFDDDAQIEDVLTMTAANAALLDPPIDLVIQSSENAKEHLEETLNNVMFRKNVSKTPELGSTKAKMNIATVWLPALKANGDPAYYTDKATGEVIDGVPYFDENGNLIKTATEAKPIIITYTDDDPDTDGNDVWAAVSRDDGQTWKRKNLSRAGYRSSFTLPDGAEAYGHVKKPVFQVKGNKVLVAWRGTYCRGGKPRYAIKIDDPETPENEDDNPYDNDYYTEDLWGVSGPQRSHDYTEDGYPDVGVMPFAALWTCRGLILTQKDLTTVAGTDSTGLASTWADMGYELGDIVWFKPERLTSGRRDVNQIFCGAASSAGFALVWQEDPNGIRPGKAVGPGPGWGGATTSHKTDIWYSYLTWGDHSKVDMNFVPGGDPEHNVEEGDEDPRVFLERPKALVPMTLPIRLSDNDVLNAKNMKVDETTYEDDLVTSAENLTRCVKFEGGKTITAPDDLNAYDADYAAVMAILPEDHISSMNCTNCHVPFGTDPMGDTPTQGAPIPLVVVSADPLDYLGGFSNGDCVSCHFSNVVPRDRVIAVASGLDEDLKCAECESKGGIWMDGTDGKDLVEAYYPYEGYPYIEDSDSDADGTHNYWKAVPDLLVYQEGDVVNPYLGYETDTLDPTDNFYEYTNFSDKVTQVAITQDGRILDGDTGASRANIFLQPYTFTKPDGTPGNSAWAIITYEETKGAGAGPPDNTGSETGLEDGSTTHRDDYLPESGKNIIYHSFDFKTPDLVSAGNIINMPEAEYTEDTDENGLPIRMPILDGDGNITPRYIRSEPTTDEFGNVIAEGEVIPDWLGRPQLAYENARRGRFILQGIGAVRSSRAIMIMVYKEGEEGSGRPSDIMMQRWVIPEDEIVFKYKDGKINGVLSVEGNPYRFDNIVGNMAYDELAEMDYRASGPVNISAVTPTVTVDSQGDPQYEDAYGATKVVEWVQTVDNLADLSGKHPYDDARAHRGQIRGNFVQVGYSHTANWAAARNGHDKYDFYIRRSFNGGATFTTMPASMGGQGVEHCRTWTYPAGTYDGTGDPLDTNGGENSGTKIEVCTFYPAGEFEAARNLTQLPNNKESTIEPRIVAVPGTIKVAGVWTGIPEDKQDPKVFYVAWGTSDNPIKDPITKEQDEPAPADLYYSFSRDMGETYYIQEWVVNPDSQSELAGETVYRTPWMAKGDQEQGEVQLRMTPDGTRFYASWLDEGDDGSDIVFRRIMSIDFPQNNATTTTTDAGVEEDITSSDDFSSDSGGE